MTDLAIMPRMVNPQSATRKPDDPVRIREAAQQFEALLLGQMLRSVREDGGNWLSTGEGSTGDSATDFAEQQFAASMAQHGGLGLGTLITQGLNRK